MTDLISPKIINGLFNHQTPVFINKRLQPSPSPLSNDQTNRSKIIINRISKKRRVLFDDVYNVSFNENTYTPPQVFKIQVYIL